MVRLRVAGVWLDSVAAYTDPVVTRRLGQGGGGVSEVTWEMDLQDGSIPGCLTRGSLVELFNGGFPAGRAILGQPGRAEDGIEFSATGEYRQAEATLCLTELPTQVSTVIPDQAIDAAISRGALPWTRPTTVFSGAAAATANGLNYLNVLLDAVADATGRRWYVTDDGRVQMAADTTAPKWLLAPGLVELGAEEDGYASHLFGRYVLNTTSTLQTASTSDEFASGLWGRREFGTDLTPAGPMTASAAKVRLDGLLAKGKARLRPVDRLDVNNQQLLTIGGQPASLELVRPGDMVRAPGRTPLSLNGAPYFDFVIGETSHDGGPTLTIAPVDLAARNLEDVLSLAPASTLTA